MNRAHASHPIEAHGDWGSLESRTAMRCPFSAISMQALPDASECEDLRHVNSDKGYLSQLAGDLKDEVSRLFRIQRQLFDQVQSSAKVGQLSR